ncbi:MAG: glycosyltransferase family 9 protein [Ktedonobacteraceae bacterium]
MRGLLRTIILTLIRIVGALQLTRAAQSPQPGRTLRILLLRPDHLGDLLLTTPILQALRSNAPEAHITMLVGPWSSEVVARHPALDQLKTCQFPGFQRAPQKALDPYILLFRMARQLQQENYDLAINLRPDFWWGAALLYLAGIPQRVGYALQPGAPFLTRALAFPAAEHATVSNLRLASAGLQAAGYPGLTEPYTPERYPLAFVPTEAEQGWVSEQFQQASMNAEETFVVIHAGTGGAVKLWRAAAWSRVADTLARTEILPVGARIVLTGSPGERPMLEEIARGMQISVPLQMTNTTVGQLAALLSRARLVLGVDNGPLHMAAAQDMPSLRLFGPTDPHIFGPWGSAERHRVIAATQRCATCPAIPCGRLDFRPEELPEHPCVRNISEQQVLHAITELLQITSPVREQRAAQ